MLQLSEHIAAVFTLINRTKENIDIVCIFSYIYNPYLSIELIFCY